MTMMIMILLPKGGWLPEGVVVVRAYRPDPTFPQTRQYEDENYVQNKPILIPSDHTSPSRRTKSKLF